MACDQFPGFIRGIGVMEQFSILRVDEAVVFQQLPVNHPAPKFPSHQNDRDADHFPGLKQRQGLEQFIARAESSWERDQGFRA
jgi:hypothetical protein